MASPILIPKKSTIANKVPLPSQLAGGEVSVNWADQVWHGKHPSTNAVVPIGAPAIHSHDELYSINGTQHLELQNNGDLTLPNGGTISDSSAAQGSITLTPPNATAGQGLVIRPTVGVSLTNDVGFSAGATITVTLTDAGSHISDDWTANGGKDANWAYTITGITTGNLGSALTGTFAAGDWFISGGNYINTKVFNIPANSTGTGFNIRLDDPITSAYSGFPTPPNLELTIGATSTLPETGHLHLVTADPTNVDLYLGDDYQYVKVQRNYGNVVISNYAPAVTGTTSTLSNGLEAFYKLDDLTDSSGNGNNLTNSGGVIFSSGKIGNCGVFGANDYLTKAPWNIGLSFTVSFWTNIDSLSDYQWLVIQYAGMCVYTRSNGALEFGNAQSWNASTPSGVIQPNTWYHCVLVSNNGYGTLYIDGVSQASDNSNQLNLIDSADRPFGIGNDGQSGGNSIQKQFDAVGIWNRALTPAEIAELYNSGTGKETPFSTGSLAVSNQWTFKTDGVLELPPSGDITIAGSSILGGGVQANWNSTSGPSKILNKPTLATVATSGSYTDLSGLPTLGTAAATNSSDYATATQGATADSALQASALTPYRTSANQDIIDAGFAVVGHTHNELNSPNLNQHIELQNAGNIVISNYTQGTGTANGLLAFYKLDDLTDSSGNGNTLTNVGGVAFGAGKIGDCAIFDANGAGGKHLATPVSGGPGSGLTVSMWAKVVSTSVAGTLVQSCLADQSGWFIGLDAASSRLAYLAGSGSWAVADLFGNPLSANVWYHIVKKADASGVKIYIDGVEAGSWTNNTWTSALIEIGHFAFHSGSRDESWNGSIDAVGIWDRALTSSEIAELYNSGAGKEIPFSTGSPAISNQWIFKPDGTIELPPSGDITIAGSSVLGSSGAQADWSATSGAAQILNKPTLGTAASASTSDFAASTHNHDATDITSGTLNDSRLSANVVLTSDARLSDARTPTTHQHPLSDLTQSSATTGQVVAWNGAAWAPSTPAASGVSSVAGRTGAVTLSVTDVTNAVGSVTTGIANTTPITNMMQITQTGYNTLGASVSPNTLYIIVG